MLTASLDEMKSAVKNAENKYELLKAGLDPAKSSSIPKDVNVVTLVTPVKGIASKYRPYGDYTVYASAKGTKYHTRHGCGNATRPMHFFSTLFAFLLINFLRTPKI